MKIYPSEQFRAIFIDVVYMNQLPHNFFFYLIKLAIIARHRKSRHDRAHIQSSNVE